MADPISTANSAVSHITGAIRQAAQKEAPPVVALRPAIAAPARFAAVAMPVVAAAKTAAILDPAGTALAFADYQPARRIQDDTGPVFHALFHTGERRAARSGVGAHSSNLEFNSRRRTARRGQAAGGRDNGKSGLVRLFPGHGAEYPRALYRPRMTLRTIPKV